MTLEVVFKDPWRPNLTVGTFNSREHFNTLLVSRDSCHNYQNSLLKYKPESIKCQMCFFEEFHCKLCLQLHEAKLDS